MALVSTRSGSGTPVQIAPTVPSMLPRTNTPPTGRSVSLDTLTALRHHKYLRATHSSQTTDGPGAMEVKILKAQNKALELQSAQQISDLKRLEGQMTDLKRTVERLQEERARTQPLEDLERRILTDLGATIKTEIESAIQQMEARKNQAKLEGTVQALDARLQGLDKTVEQMGHGLQKIQRTTEKQLNDFKEGQSSLSSQLSTVAETQKILQDEHKGIVERCEELDKGLEKLHANQSRLADHQADYRSDQIIDHSQLKNDLTNLVDTVDAATKGLLRLDGRVKKLETDLETVVTHRGISDTNINASISQPDLDVINERLRVVEEQIEGANGQGQAINELQQQADEFGKTLHDIKNDLGTTSLYLKNVFGEYFDPLQARVQEQLESHRLDLDKQSESLNRSQERLTKLEGDYATSRLSASQMTSIRDLLQAWPNIEKDWSHVQAFSKAEAERCSTAIENLRQQVGMKQDVVAATQAIDTVKAAVRNLQTQYDNVSTDHLHQKMVHWFVQNYSGAPADLIQQFLTVKHEVKQLQGFANIITGIPNGAQALAALAQMSTPAELLLETNKASASLVRSMEEIRKQHQDLKDDQTASIQALDLKFEALMKKRNEAECTAFLGSNKRLEHLVPEIQAISELVNDLQGKLKDISDFATPENKEFVAHLPLLFAHTAQQQSLLEGLNQTLKKPLEIRWSFDWKKQVGFDPPYRDTGDSSMRQSTRKR